MVTLSIKPSQALMLRALVKNLPPLDPILGPWVAGGSVRSVALGSLEDVHDIDVFFKDQKQRDNFARQLEILGYESSVTDSSLVFSYTREGSYPVQLIGGSMHNNRGDSVWIYYDSAEKVINDFSLTACQFITDGHTIWAHPDALADAKAKRFIITNDSRLNIGFVNKYLDSYGYVYDGNRDDLAQMSLMGEMPS